MEKGEEIQVKTTGEKKNIEGQFPNLKQEGSVKVQEALFLPKRTAGTKMEKRRKESRSNDHCNLGSISWGLGVGQQDLTLCLML